MTPIDRWWEKVYSVVSWSSKRQPTASRSSAEAEYRDVANTTAECIWLRQLLGELHSPIQRATVVFCDNVSTVYMSRNPVHHKCTKHIELDIHFVRERVQTGELRVLHVPTDEQYADIMTKGLTTRTFEAFRACLCVHAMKLPTAGGVVIECKYTPVDLNWHQRFSRALASHDGAHDAHCARRAWPRP
jgi:hypothetical protein